MSRTSVRSRRAERLPTRITGARLAPHDGRDLAREARPQRSRALSGTDVIERPADDDLERRRSPRVPRHHLLRQLAHAVGRRRSERRVLGRAGRVGRRVDRRPTLVTSARHGRRGGPAPQQHVRAERVDAQRLRRALPRASLIGGAGEVIDLRGTQLGDRPVDGVGVEQIDGRASAASGANRPSA